MTSPPRKQIPEPPPIEIAMFSDVTKRASAASIVEFRPRFVLVNGDVCTPLRVMVGFARVTHGTSTGGGCATSPQAARTATTVAGDHATAILTVPVRKRPPAASISC